MRFAGDRFADAGLGRLNLWEAVEALYADITLVDTSEILNEEDHTLHFRIWGPARHAAAAVASASATPATTTRFRPAALAR